MTQIDKKKKNKKKIYILTFSLLAQLCCNQNDMFDYRSSVVP